MSDEIKIDPKVIDHTLKELGSSIEALEISFAKEIKGKNKLDMVESFNEIRNEYEELLMQFRNLFLMNVQGADKSIEALRETERMAAQGIRMLE